MSRGQGAPLSHVIMPLGIYGENSRDTVMGKAWVGYVNVMPLYIVLAYRIYDQYIGIDQRFCICICKQGMDSKYVIRDSFTEGRADDSGSR